MKNVIRRNIPPKSYAVKREKPKLRRQVEQTLTNRYPDTLHPRQDLTNIDTYYVHSKDVYYQGNWMGGLPHGRGTAIYPDGSYFIGTFDEGQAQDTNGYLILPNGAEYTGNVVKSKIEGVGKLVHKLTYTYEGPWHNGKPNGFGKETYDDGSSFEGFFENGQKHCYEERSIQDKKLNKPKKMSVYRKGDQVYVGEFFKGLMHGYGELNNQKRKLKYSGEFEHGNKKGFGSLETSQGILTGYFNNDFINGNGQFAWRDGRRYKGYFQNNKFHEQGTITFPEGNMLVGKWNEGQSESLKAVFGNSKRLS